MVQKGWNCWSIVLAAMVWSVTSVARAGSPPNLGVPDGGFPSWAERSLQVFVNRDRADPQAALATCTPANCPDAPCYAPVPPLAYDRNLGRSARFQLLNLQAAHSPLAHHSPCELDPTIGASFPESCDGNPSCACKGPLECDCSQGTATDCTCDSADPACVTQPYSRGLYFSPHWNGENLSAGYDDPMAAEAGLLLERAPCVPTTCPAAATNCPDGTTNGHRSNILYDQFDLMGGGDAIDPAACYQGPWNAEDFGIVGSLPQKLVAGTHFPYDAGSVTFYANWYDNAAPASAVVRIDGIDHTMGTDRGSGGNVTLSFAAVLDAGCHSYLFAFDDSTGESFLLPGTGTYQAGTGCVSDYASDNGSPDGGADGGSGAPKGSGCTQGGEVSGLAPIALAGLVLLARRRRSSSQR
jgi:hypothetical protein